MTQPKEDIRNYFEPGGIFEMREKDKKRALQKVISSEADIKNLIAYPLFILPDEETALYLAFLDLHYTDSIYLKRNSDKIEYYYDWQWVWYPKLTNLNQKWRDLKVVSLSEKEDRSEPTVAGNVFTIQKIFAYANKNLSWYLLDLNDKVSLAVYLTQDYPK